MRPKVLEESVISHVDIAVHENPNMDMNLKFRCPTVSDASHHAAIWQDTDVEFLDFAHHFHIASIRISPSHTLLGALRNLIVCVGFSLASLLDIHGDADVGGNGKMSVLRS